MPNPARSRCHQCRMPMTGHTSWCPYSPGKLSEARIALEALRPDPVLRGMDFANAPSFVVFSVNCAHGCFSSTKSHADAAAKCPECNASAPQSDEDYARSLGWVEHELRINVPMPNYWLKGPTRIQPLPNGRWATGHANTAAPDGTARYPSLRAAVDAADQAMAGEADALPAGWEWHLEYGDLFLELRDHGNWRGNAYQDGLFVIRDDMADHRAPEPTLASAKRALVAELKRRGVMG